MNTALHFAAGLAIAAAFAALGTAISFGIDAAEALIRRHRQFRAQPRAALSFEAEHPDRGSVTVKLALALLGAAGFLLVALLIPADSAGSPAPVDTGSVNYHRCVALYADALAADTTSTEPVCAEAGLGLTPDQTSAAYTEAYAATH